MNKPWGAENVLTPRGAPYCMKVLEINRGCRTSLQAHTEKHETLHIAKGRALVTIGASQFEMEAPRTVTIPPDTRHRVTALTRCVIYEASTPETGETIRFEDDYGRGNEVLG